MAAERVVVAGSLRPFLAAGATAVLLGTLGLAAWRTGGSGPGVTAAMVGAALATTVFLGDLPRRTEADADGLVRICLVRHGRIPWDRVVAVERQRRRLAGPGTGGLVVRGRRGRWLVATSAEPPAVHAALVRLVATHAPAVRMEAEAPAVVTDRR